MSWPELNQCIKAVDWSWYQNDGSTQHKPFDVDAFCAAHPYVELAVIRACWPDGSPDPHYPHYYDGFHRNNKKVAAYLWPNPKKAIGDTLEDWKRALGARIPKLLAYDYEEATTFAGVSNARVTQAMRESWEVAHLHFPNQKHINYSRGNWLATRIVLGAWFHEIPWWIAHYIYPTPNVPKMAAQFSQIDSILPIGNSFTPARGPVLLENVKGWQFTSGLQIVPNGTSDGDYFLKSFINPIYGEEPPPVPSPKVPVTIQVPKDKVDIRIVEL